MKIRIFIMLVLIILAILELFIFNKGTIKTVNAEQITNNDIQQQDELQTILQLFYLDGEVTSEMIREDVNDIEQLWDEYKDWKLVEINVDHIIFQKKSNDILPVLQANGYFGLTEEGILTVFQGKPEEINVIKSFHEIDLDRLNSIQQEQLKKGIPFQTMENFHDLYNTFKQYRQTSVH